MSVSRNLTIDVARGFIILLVPAIHVTLLYSNDAVKAGVLGFILRCFAEGPGAQLFMFLMGFCIVLSRKKSPKIILRRSVLLFLSGYLLNFFKFILPGLFGLVPNELFSAYGLSQDIFGYIDLFFIGDILQLAAFSYLLCAFLYLFKYGFYTTFFLAIFMVLFSPFFWDINSPSIFIDLFVRLFNGFPPVVFFPFFPWSSYSLFGLLFGYLYLKMDASSFYLWLFKIGLAFCFSGLLIIFFEPPAYNSSFYRLGPGGTIFHLGIVFIWIRLCHEMAIRKANSRFVRFLCYLSRRVISIYIIQWVLICWFLVFFGFNQNGLFDTCVEIFIMTLLTIGITYVLEFIRNHISLLKLRT